MATQRADQPVEGDNLSPVTVKVGDDTDDQEEGQDTEDQDQTPPAQDAETPPVAAQGQGRQPGQRPANQSGSPNRPSRNAYLQKQITQATAPYEQKIAALERQLSEAVGRIDQFSRMGAQQQGGQGQDKATTEIQAINRELNNLVMQAADPNLSDAMRNSLVQRHNELADRKQDLVDEAKWAKRKEEWQKEMEQQRESPDVAAARSVIASEFPAIAENDQAAARAKAYFNYLVAENGGRETIGLLRQACAYVQHKMGLGQRPGPSGMERGAQMGTGGSGGQRQTNGEYTFNEQDMRVMRGAPVSPRQVAEYMKENGNE